jgi:hypothetical protein
VNDASRLAQLVDWTHLSVAWEGSLPQKSWHAPTLVLAPTLQVVAFAEHTEEHESVFPESPPAPPSALPLLELQA